MFIAYEKATSHCVWYGQSLLFRVEIWLLNIGNWVIFCYTALAGHFKHGPLPWAYGLQ